ncbi:hypothetical protein B0J11DRAFT_561143 [Dendryphion nanum]|uniref:Acyl-CoA N-acyltransferase n=1 Tax=Dendryphion nanum TaxID=256645 RepID=A0A9P9DCF0_9PLEO|nr:hypothetical protein B0J11DRAFT_561143 [Dendryphion nanum]
MLQSSITAWLKKPASVTQPIAPSSARVHPSSTVIDITPPEPLLSPLSNPPLKTIVTNPFAFQPLPPNVELVPLTEDLMPAFKRLNALLLPIPYPQAYYNETMMEPHHSLTLMALWYTESVIDPTLSSTEEPDQSANIVPARKGKPRLIGAIRCRILPSSTLYISTLGLLSPYRSYGIATHLLHNIAVRASEEHGIKCITAHVWEANDVGLEWYEKRGFETIGKEDVYYRKLKPSGAMLAPHPNRLDARQKDVTFTITCLGPSCTTYPPTTISIPTTLPGGEPISQSATTTKKPVSSSSTKKPEPVSSSSTKKPEPVSSSSTKKPEPPKTSTPVSTTKKPSSTSKYTPPPEPPTKTSKQPETPTKTGGEVGPSSTRCPVPLYYQCGGYYDGKPWTGCTKCVSGAKCVVQNEWYDQCVSIE